MILGIIIVIIVLVVSIIYYYNTPPKELIKDYEFYYQKWYVAFGKDLDKLSETGFYSLKLSRKDMVQRAYEDPIKYIEKYIFDKTESNDIQALLKHIEYYNFTIKDLILKANQLEELYIQEFVNKWKDNKRSKNFHPQVRNWDDIKNTYEDTYYIYCYSESKQGITAKKIYINNKTLSVLKQNFENKQAKIAKKVLAKSKVNSVSMPQTNGMATKEFIKEQRNIMNRKYANDLTLRDWILKRDNYTCQCCGNSIAKEPNLLLEVDHIHPVSKWGPSIPENLQTLCWKCNREKSNKEN